MIVITTVLFVFTGLILNNFYKAKGEINIYNWDKYMSAKVVSDFEEKYDIKVNQFYFDNQNDVLNEFRSGRIADQYDIVFFGDEFAEELVNGGYLSSLNKNNIPNIKYINKRFSESKLNAMGFYVVPYNWGTVGLLVNKKYVPEEDWHWKSFFYEEYEDKVCLLRDSSEVIALAAKYLGMKIVPQSITEMEKARNLLVTKMQGRDKYCGDFEIPEKMLSGEIWIAQYWNGWAYDFVRNNEGFEYVVPSEGGGVWSDMMAVPKDAKNRRAAELFMNYVNNPKVAAQNVNDLFYASTNDEAQKYVNKDILNNKIIYPDDILLKGDFFIDFPIDNTIMRMRDELWQEINK